MIRLGIFSLFVGLLLACQPQPKRPSPEKPVDLKVSKEEKLVPKERLFLTLNEAGLNAEERPPKRLPKKAEEALPEEPLQQFMLVVDNEGWWMLEFSTVNLAEVFEMDFETGFRFRNWFFCGSVSIEVTNRVKKALSQYRDISNSNE